MAQPVPLSKDQEVNNPHGSYLDVYFDKYVPEMSAAQLRESAVSGTRFQCQEVKKKPIWTPCRQR